MHLFSLIGMLVGSQPRNLYDLLEAGMVGWHVGGQTVTP